MRASSFNADFYVVAATIIPVWFVAVMLPGGILARYAVWARQLRARQSKRIGPAMNAGKLSGTRLWLILRFRDVLTLPDKATLTFAGVGEVCAVLSLDRGHATGFEHWWVLVSVVGLPVVTVIGAQVAILGTWTRDLTGESDIQAAE